MNYLAHLLLSGPDPDWRLGGLLGDFVKGPLRGERPQAIEAGIRLHRRIDASADRHPSYHLALTNLHPRWRRHGGIILDIWFDHLLSRHWDDWYPQPLDAFCSQCWTDFRARKLYIPPPAQAFICRAEQFTLLQSYCDEQGIARVLTRVSERLSRPLPLQQALPELIDGRVALTEIFNDLFNYLLLEAKRFRQQYPGADSR
ncbi:ACP phosphodiesterase [Microbulbifer sp. TYP-18]|uniref:acyl carrier protein phosphodiesterase n=1 Tax=Microbulbifer sp. TYP-18 TaxID=3230024 RepID=UPI0034C60E58